MPNQSYDWNLENMIPWDVEQQKKQTQKDTDATKESFQDKRRDQRDPEKVSRGRPKAPEAPQRPSKAQKYEKPE